MFSYMFKRWYICRFSASHFDLGILSLKCFFNHITFYHIRFPQHIYNKVWKLYSRDNVDYKAIPGPHLNIKTVFSGMWIPMLKIRLSWDFLILTWGSLYWLDNIFILRWSPGFNGHLEFQINFFYKIFQNGCQDLTKPSGTLGVNTSHQNVQFP